MQLTPAWRRIICKSHTDMTRLNINDGINSNTSQKAHLRKENKQYLFVEFNTGEVVNLSFSFNFFLSCVFEICSSVLYAS